MKVAEIVSPMAIGFAEREIPVPEGDQVLVKISYAGICGTDLKIFDGSIPYYKQGLLKYPMIPGHEWSGVVSAVGDQVLGFSPGDRVTGECHIGCGKCNECLNGRTNICQRRVRVGIIGQDGGFAQYILLPERAIHSLPEGVTDKEGALVEPLTVALHALDKLDTLAGSNVLVFGLGPIGLLVCQVANVLGAAKVIGVDIDEGRIAFARRYGCDFVTSSTKEALRHEIEEITLGHGVDVIVEAAGVSSLFGQAIELIRPGGQISLVGLYSANVQCDANQLISKDVRLHGNMASARVWDRAIRLIESKKIIVQPLITQEFLFQDIKKAMETAYDKSEPSIKIMIKFGE
ncbi:zinc-dependent alcohol dehydrogenase [Ammoniphilus resinae]|nr:alcohol dehydrogenase catalytic domain-containing protein [Ammoniphilus resinae]